MWRCVVLSDGDFTLALGVVLGLALGGVCRLALAGPKRFPFLGS